MVLGDIAEAALEGVGDGSSSMFEFFGTFFSAILYTGATYLKLWAAWDHISRGNILYGVVTLILVLGSVLVISIFSYFTYQLADKSKTSRCERAVRLTFDILLQPRLLRQLRCMYYDIQIYLSKDGKDHFKALKKECKKHLDFLSFLERYLEDAPGLVVQIAFLLENVSETGGSNLRNNWIQFLSILLNVASLAYSISDHAFQSRKTRKDATNMTKCGQFLNLKWQFGILGLRVWSLSLFGSVYPVAMLVCCFLHWILFSLYLSWEESENYQQEQKIRNIPKAGQSESIRDNVDNAQESVCMEPTNTTALMKSVLGEPNSGDSPNASRSPGRITESGGTVEGQDTAEEALDTGQELTPGESQATDESASLKLEESEGKSESNRKQIEESDAPRWKRRLQRYFQFLIYSIVHIFIAFNIVDGSTRQKYWVFYSICLLENAGFLYFGLDYYFTHFQGDSALLSVLTWTTVVSAGLFWLGIAIMLIYYRYCHPTLEFRGDSEACCHFFHMNASYSAVAEEERPLDNEENTVSQG